MSRAGGRRGWEAGLAESTREGMKGRGRTPSEERPHVSRSDLMLSWDPLPVAGSPVDVTQPNGLRHRKHCGGFGHVCGGLWRVKRQLHLLTQVEIHRSLEEAAASPGGLGGWDFTHSET